jgi:hypothetical protein
MKTFAIWSHVPNSSIATGNLLPADFPKIGITLKLFVTEIPEETSQDDVIKRLYNSKYANLSGGTGDRRDKIEKEFTSSGFRSEWPSEVIHDESSFLSNNTGLVITWDSLK